MSFRVRLLVVLALVSVLRAAPAAAGLCVDVEVHVDGVAPARDLVDSFEGEAAAIWAPYGVDLRWRPAACPAADVSFDVMVERRLPDALLHTRVLGTTHVQLTCTDRVPIRIDAAATESAIRTLSAAQLMDTTGRPWLGPTDIGRALGRVLAHEIGHVLLGLPNHQLSGLMRRSFQPADMVRQDGAQYTLSDDEVARLRHRSEMVLTRRDTAGAADAPLEVCLTGRAARSAR